MPMGVVMEVVMEMVVKEEVEEVIFLGLFLLKHFVAWPGRDRGRRRRDMVATHTLFLWLCRRYPCLLLLLMLLRSRGSKMSFVLLWRLLQQK